MSSPDDAPAPAEQQPLATPARSMLPGSVMATAVLLLIFGALAGLGTALMLFTIVLFAAFPIAPYPDPFMDPNFPGYDPMTGMWGPDLTAMWWIGLASVALIALLGAAVAGGHVAAGIGILKQRAWGRILGMVVSGAALIVVVLGLASIVTSAVMPMPPGFEDFPPYTEDYYASMMTTSLVFGAVFSGLVISAYAYILVVLARRGDAFD